MAFGMRLTIVIKPINQPFLWSPKRVKSLRYGTSLKVGMQTVVVR